MLHNTPKHQAINQKLIVKTIAHCLDGLLNDKYSINELLSVDLVEKFKESLLSKGDSAGIKSNEAFVDKEIIDMMDKSTKAVSLYVNRSINFNITL